MSANPTLIVLSLAMAAVFGVLMIGWRASALRTGVKAAAVAFLAIAAYVAGAPLPLIAALTASAVGDAFLAGDAKRWLAGGLAAFLLAQIAYVWLFVDDGFGWVILEAEPARAVGAAAALAAGAALLVWIWRSLDALRPAVAAYAAALSLMTATAFTLPHRLWPAMAGSAAFMISNAILAARLFKGLRGRWADYLVWWSYYGAQFAIAWAFFR
jgi:uncharacterized membrane protein YhhN